MRVLLDQGLYDMRNVGNMAMLLVTAERLRKRWPQAMYEIITYGPHLSKIYFPYAHPVNPFNPFEWSQKLGRYDRLHRLIPVPFWRLFFEIREELWDRWPKAQSVLRMHANRQPVEPNIGDSNMETGMSWAGSTDMVLGADLFVATGSQYMTDIAKDAALKILDRLELAVKQDIPTAMVGQGIGPITDPLLIARAKAVLPSVDLICVREQSEAPQILNSFGVDPARVRVTGDDAIELAYNARPAKVGNGIGISLRIAPYTEVSKEHLEIIRMVLFQAADKYRAPLISLPISQSLHEKDERSIRQLLTGYNNVRFTRSKFYTPWDAIRNTGRCRLVVTGTYHAAVFALAQGIPAICLAKSASYVNKLNGLADMFGLGCEVIYLDDKMFRDKLSSAVENAWQMVDSVHPPLLKAAMRQIQSGYDAYEQIYKLVETRRESHLAIENLK